MLVFANHRCVNQDIVNNFVTMNLSSLLEGFPTVDILPPFKLDRYDRDFDIMYLEYILNDNNKFYEFMKIIMSLYYAVPTLILVGNDELYETVTESLIKLIQQRYGYLSNLIYNPEDWECVQDSEFSIHGLYNLDIDKERFAVLHAMRNNENIN
ncbi:MAG: hypothetical protein ACRDD7_14645 [Peptostreptococcaceae bacterium]